MNIAPQGLNGPRIAVIGGGISGMGAAYALSGTQNVTLYEAAPRLGQCGSWSGWSRRP